MAKQNISRTKKTPAAPAKDLRRIDAYLDQYDQTHQNPANRVIGLVTAFLAMIALSGVFWWLPFPHLAFLGVYSSNFSWASPFIGFTIYFYYRHSPVLSYVMLLFVFGFTYIVSQTGGTHVTASPLWVIYLVILIVLLLVQLVGFYRESKKPLPLEAALFLWVGPVYWIARVFKKRGWRY